jgi:hypothetical protein
VNGVVQQRDAVTEPSTEDFRYDQTERGHHGPGEYARLHGGVRVPRVRPVRMTVRMFVRVPVSRLVPTGLLAVFAVIMAMRLHLRYCTCPLAALPLVVLLVRQFDTPAPRIN